MPQVRQNTMNKSVAFNLRSSKTQSMFSRNGFLNQANSRPKSYPSLRNNASQPKKSRWGLGEEGITNRRDDYNRALQLGQSAVKARDRQAKVSLKTIASNNISSAVYDGNAAKKINHVPFIRTKHDNESSNKDKGLHVFKGKTRGIMQTSSLSPNLVSLTKIAASVFVVFAIMAFVRIGLTSATVSNSLQYKDISSQLDEELVKKNNLEVQTSALSNSARIKTEAAAHNLVNAPTVLTISIPNDVLAYEDDNVSLVDSLNRLASTNQ